MALADEAAEMLATFPKDDATASYLHDELVVAMDALRLGITSALTDEPFVAMVCVRVIVEAAIRMSWLLAEGPNEPAIRVRLARLEKHDLEQAISASEKMDEVASWGPIVENQEELRSYLGELGGKSAPDVRQMAKEAGWEWLYALHRLCSVAIHPGLGSRARIAYLMELKELELPLLLAFSGATVSIGAIARALFGIDASAYGKNAIVLANKGFPETPHNQPPRRV